MKHFFSLLAILLAFSLPAAELTDAVVAKVGDKIITAFKLRLASMSDEALLPQGMNPDRKAEAIAEMRAGKLDELILQELVWMDFKELKATVPAEMIQERIDEIVAAKANSDEERFRDMLHKENIPYQEFLDHITQQAAVDILLYERTRRNIFITNAQIEKYFREHQTDFQKASRYHLQAILLKKNAESAQMIQKIRARLAQGEDFGALARECSQGANAAGGGDLGWMDSMAPALEALVKSMKPGTVALRDLEIGNSIYIVKLLAREGGEKAQLTQEIKKQIRQLLEDQTAQQKKEEYIKTLYMKYPVRKYL